MGIGLSCTGNHSSTARPRTRLAGDLNEAPDLAQGAVDEREAESLALTYGVEGLERASAYLPVDPPFPCPTRSAARRCRVGAQVPPPSGCAMRVA